MRVVNFRDYGSAQVLDEEFMVGGVRTWVYIGRGNPYYKLPHSPLHNRWSHNPNARAHKVESRDEAVNKYRQWLWQQIKAENPDIMKALAGLQPSTVLVCFCKPAACHGDVIAEALQSEEVQRRIEEWQKTTAR